MLVRNTSLYMAANVFTALFGVLSMVAFTRLLNPAEYGVYVVGVSGGAFVNGVLFTWVRYSAMRFQSEGGSVDVRTTVYIAWAISALASPAAVAVAAYLSQASIRAGLCISLFALGLSVYEVTLELLKARQQVKSAVMAQSLRSAFAFSFGLLSATLTSSGLSQILAAAGAYTATTLISAPFLASAPLAPIQFDKLGTFLRLGGSMTLAGLITSLHAAMDRWLVAFTLGEGAAGLYGAPADLVRQIVLIFAGSVTAASIPMIVAALAQNGEATARRHLASTAELLLAVTAPTSVGLALTSPYLASVLLGPAFRETAGLIMPALAAAWFFQSFVQCYVHISFHLSKRALFVILHGMAPLLVNGVLIFPMTHRFGLQGAAFSIMVAEATGMLVAWTLTKRSFAIPLPVGTFVRVAFACGAMALGVMALLRALPAVTPAHFFILAGAGIVIYACAAYAVDLAGARSMVRSMLERRLTLNALPN